GLPTGQAQRGGAAHRQRAVAPGEAGGPGNGREPALEVQAAAQLQPAAQPHRTLLEDAQAKGDSQSPVRQPGGPQGLSSQQPPLLPDRAATGRYPAQWPEETPGKPD